MRYMTEEIREGRAVWLRLAGWWLYDWKEKKGVHKFPVAEEEQARGLCKLLNSIEEENDGSTRAI